MRRCPFTPPDGILVNTADPGFTGTDFNNNRGTQTVTEGTDAIVRLATLPEDGPTGTFQDRNGTVPWYTPSTTGRIRGRVRREPRRGAEPWVALALLPEGARPIGRTPPELEISLLNGAWR